MQILPGALRNGISDIFGQTIYDTGGFIFTVLIDC